MNQAIIILSMIFIYYHISGLSTTNILRLTAGNTLPILSSKCCCDHCGATIPPFFQLPILSFALCKGRCRACGVKIPLFPLILEITVFLGMSAISALFHFSFSGVTFSFLLYELIRVIVILYNGKREIQFKKQYLIAIFSMLPFYFLTLFVALIYFLVV